MKILFCHRGTPVPDQWLAELRAALPGHQLQPWRPGLPADHELAVVWNPPQQLFDEQPRLRAVFNLGAGVDQLLSLDLPPALPVLRLEDAGMAVQMAEYICHAVIRFFREFDRYDAQQRQGLWNPRPLRERAEFPVGVMGLGRLGTRVLQALRAFDFPLHGWSRSAHHVDGVHCHAGPQQLRPFLRATRILVCLLPLTAQTRGIVDAQALARLRPGACLINVARGGLIVEPDLRAGLDSGALSAAVLDVMAQEPLPADHWMWRHPRVTLTPHISGMTVRAVAAEQVVRAVQALEAGQLLPGRVQRARGY